MATRREHPLAGLLGAQALAVFIDNVLRVVVIFLLLGPDRPEDAHQEATTLAFLAFTVPFVALSLVGGLVVDRVGKRRVVVVLMALEALTMLFAAWALPRADRAPGAALGVLACLGAIHAFYSPAKYGALPELLPAGRLSWGNGQLQFWIYLATLLGVAGGGPLLDVVGDHRWVIGAALALAALLGLGAALRMPARPAARRQGGLLATVRAGWRDIRTSPHLRLGVLASLWFWSLAGLLQQDLVVYARVDLGLNDTAKSLLLGALFLGIGLGSLAAGLASRGRIALQHVPWGAGGMAVTTALFGLTEPGYGAAALLLLAMGAASGFFLVPVNSLIQIRAPTGDRGAVLATMNVLIFTGILAGSAAATALANLGLDSPRIMLVLSGLALAGTLYALRIGPRALPPA